MSTLKEEREAIVDMIDDIMAKYHMGEHMYSPEREEIVATILSYEEKVMERVRKEKEDIFGEIEQFKSEVATMNYNDDFKDGIYATIEHILSMPCFESVLTPITE